MTYSIEEHIHRFAVWTAARAAQRGFVGTNAISKAIEAADLQQQLKKLHDSVLNEKLYDAFHKSMAASLQHALIQQIESDCPPEKISALKSKVTYGRAAKIIAVYVKTACVIRFPDCNLSRLAHPPIDSILLKNLSENYKIGLTSYKWTKLCECEYFRLINQLRNCFPLSHFWTLEEYWQPTDSKEETTAFV